jgi:hypothetical protein
MTTPESFASRIRALLRRSPARDQHEAEPEVVHGLWIGDRLGVMQRCSIQSFLAAGHAYHLHTYGPVDGVPSGAVVRDAGALIPAERIWKYRDYDSPAGFSNQFRYHLLEQHGGTWADLDVICLRPLPDAPYLLPAQALAEAPAATCLLRAPIGSPLMTLAREAAEQVDPATARWGDTGPGLLTRLVSELGLPLLPVDDVCAIDFGEWELLTSVDPAEQAAVRRRTAPSFAVHLWHEMWRRAGRTGDEPAPPGSLYADLLQRFDPPLDSIRPTG